MEDLTYKRLERIFSYDALMFQNINLEEQMYFLYSDVSKKRKLIKHLKNDFKPYLIQKKIKLIEAHRDTGKATLIRVNYEKAISFLESWIFEMEGDFSNSQKNEITPPPPKSKIKGNAGRKKAVIKDAKDYLTFELDEYKKTFIKEIKKQYPKITTTQLIYLIKILKNKNIVSDVTNLELKESFEKEFKAETQSQSNFNSRLKQDPEKELFESIEKTVKNIIYNNSLV